jgi:hypothetical protein
MLNATTHIKRTIVLAGALAAVVAPSASARLADDPHVPAPASATQPRGAESPSLADLVARHEAIATKAWQAANQPTVIEVSSSPDGGGLDLPSAGIGAAIMLTLVFFEVVGRWVLRRRRESQVRHRLA